MSECLIAIKKGRLQGKVSQDCYGGKYYSFQGIPYAKPPIGDLRFKAPQAPEKWTGILDATKLGSACYSRQTFTNEIIGSEDCLYLNVYTPELPIKDGVNNLKAVMVFIHGGGFTKGSSTTDIYNIEFLNQEDIVLVTLNYRLGLLGFLSFEDSSLNIPGNAGLKDMVMALKWVKENIEFFSGDPKNITIFGNSAGSAAIEYLMFSPMAEGLFHKAIAISGSAFNNWAIGSRSIKQLANALKLDTENEADILNNFKKLSVDEILKIQYAMIDRALDYSFTAPFGPVVETPSNEPSFLSIAPAEILASGKYNKVPFILGHNTNEGLLYELVTKYNFPFFIDDYETCVPYHLNLQKGSEQSKKIADKIKQFYVGNEIKGQEERHKHHILRSDTFINRGVNTMARNHVKVSDEPIYFYVFGCDTNLNLYKKFYKFDGPGACHGDELGYIFNTIYGPENIEPNSLEDISMKRMVKLWTNFAKYGDPNSKNNDDLIKVTWKPVTKDCFNYLSINSTLTTGTNPYAERMAFWDDITNLKPNIIIL